MEKQEQILAKADIRKEASKLFKCVFTVYYLIAFITIIVGFLEESYFDDRWYEVGFFEYFYSKNLKTGESYFFEGTFMVEVAILSVVVLLPLFIHFIETIQCRNTSLIVSNSRVNGSYNSFIWKKSLEMPIEKVDSLTIISSLIDKFRSGKTIGINSASGTIKISFVQNAEEVVSAAMDKIYEIRESRNANVSLAVAPEKTDSVSDKLQELIKMKDSGLISDEEFAKMRKDILSKM